MSLIDKLQIAISAGHAALLLTGNIHDYCLKGNDILFRPQAICDQLREGGYIVLRFSKSQGGRIVDYPNFTPKEKDSLDKRLNAVGLLSLLNKEQHNNAEEVRSFFRSVSRLLQTPREGMPPLALLVDYTENLSPAMQSSAAGTEEHVIVSETLHMLATSPALRKSRNLLICIVRDGYQNNILNELFRVEFPYPDESLTESFAHTLLTERGTQYGKLEESLSENEFARLTRGLRLRDVEITLREAKADKTPLSRKRILEAKSDAILRASEGTLKVMSTSLTIDDIVGLESAKRFFKAVAEKLKEGDPASPRAILMCGPPGTSKSTFAPILAGLSGFNILEFQNVKNMFVGESERRLSLALSQVESLSPSILFLDEITETTPSRNSGVNDGGVSLDLLGRLFMFSARDDLRGRVLLLAATNVPERLDPAWHDRFLIIPFLELLPDESRKLFGIYQKRTVGNNTLDPDAPELIEAAQILHRKGASPRKILDIVNHALLFTKNDALTPADILTASLDYAGSANPMAVAYTSLCAISLTSFQSYLPWTLEPAHYIFPWYLEGLVDSASGEMNRPELYKRMQEYRRHTNI